MNNDDYKVSLEVFEGPLDLLLYLIRRDELDIYDIQIERITAQYMAYLDVMKMLDLNIAGEFLVMAATLMLIKSRMLLPVETRKDGDDDEEMEDPRLDLVRQLVEYKKFKDAAGRLSEREAIQGERFTLGGEVFSEESGASQERSLGDIGLFDLLTAFQDVLKRVPVAPLGHIKAIIWSVPDKMEVILGKVRGAKNLAFSTIFSEMTERGEVIVTFLALLELLRIRQVAVQQLAPFTEIVVSSIPDGADAEELPAPVIG